MSRSHLLATVHLDDGADLVTDATTLQSVRQVVASVVVREPSTFDHILTIYSTNPDALDQLANALHQAANLGRAEAAAKAPAQAAAPDSSPEAADVPPTAAPGEPQAVDR